jgi:hypothetical protein
MQAESTRLVISSLSITQLMVCTIRKDGAIFGRAFMTLFAYWSLLPFFWGISNDPSPVIFVVSPCATPVSVSIANGHHTVSLRSSRLFIESTMIFPSLSLKNRATSIMFQGSYNCYQFFVPKGFYT